MKDSILGVLRHVLTTAGGAVAAQGHISEDEVSTAVGALLALVGVVWSVWQKRKAK
jgi:hypothetical protein